MMDTFSQDDHRFVTCTQQVLIYVLKGAAAEDTAESLCVLHHAQERSSSFSFFVARGVYVGVRTAVSSRQCHYNSVRACVCRPVATLDRYVYSLLRHPVHALIISLFPGLYAVRSTTTGTVRYTPYRRKYRPLCTVPCRSVGILVIAVLYRSVP